VATYKPAGEGHRNGAVRKRSESEVEIDGDDGQFMAPKDDEKFKGVRKE
jgi:hypothetical protein